MTQSTTLTQQQSTAVAKQQQKPIELFKSVINAPSVQMTFSNALGDHKDTFIASLIDLFTGDSSLQTCEPKLIIAEALRAATLRLPLNKALGFAYIVVYNNRTKVLNQQTGREEQVKIPTPTFIPGYKGYIQLAMRTGQYRTINADFVYEGELRKGNKLSGEILLDGEKKSDKIIGYFCYFELLNGFNKTLYVSIEDMAAYAKRYSPSIKKETTVQELIDKANSGIVSKKVGWEGNFNDMALKTTIRRILSKYGYLSVEMQNAIAKDAEPEEWSGRNDLIADSGNKQPLLINEATYEEVDKETGEIKTVAAPASSTPAAASPSDNAAEAAPEY